MVKYWDLLLDQYEVLCIAGALELDALWDYQALKYNIVNWQKFTVKKLSKVVKTVKI